MTAADRGYIYAATGPAYVALARRSARALRRVVGDAAEIDLFTDAPLADPVFSRVHLVERASRRPKIEALRRSRFDRTVYFDADTICLAPVDDLFDLLDRFDLAGTAEQRRGDLRVRMQHRLGDVPTAFAQINTGVLATRRSAGLDALLDEWHAVVHSGQEKFDQQSFRQLAYVSGLRLHILPAEYNVMFFGTFLGIAKGLAAPRILHLPGLHQKPPGDPLTPLIAADELPPGQVQKLATLLADDRTLARHVSLTDATAAPVANVRPRHPLAQRLRVWLRERLRRPI